MRSCWKVHRRSRYPPSCPHLPFVSCLPQCSCYPAWLVTSLYRSPRQWFSPCWRLIFCPGPSSRRWPSTSCGEKKGKRDMPLTFGLAQQIGLVLFQGEGPDQTQAIHFFDEGRLQIQSVTHQNIQESPA